MKEKLVSNLPILPQNLIRKVSLSDAKWELTKVEVNWFGHILPIGTEYKAFETDDHGYIALRKAFYGRTIYQC